MRGVIFGIVIGLAYAGPSLAETGISPETMLYEVDLADMEAIVRAVGHTIIHSDDTPEAPMVLGQDPDGLFFVLRGYACQIEDHDGCLGLSFEVRYDADDSVTLENINLANQTYKAGKVSRGMNENGVDTVFVTNYAILDGGQTAGNLGIILTNILAIGPAVADIIWPAGD